MSQFTHVLQTLAKLLRDGWKALKGIPELEDTVLIWTADCSRSTVKRLQFTRIHTAPDLMCQFTQVLQTLGTLLRDGWKALKGTPEREDTVLTWTTDCLYPNLHRPRLIMSQFTQVLQALGKLLRDGWKALKGIPEREDTVLTWTADCSRSTVKRL